YWLTFVVFFHSYHLGRRLFSFFRFFFFIIHFFFFYYLAPTEIYTLSLHDALPILFNLGDAVQYWTPGEAGRWRVLLATGSVGGRSEEHSSELQSRRDLVCRLLLEKKKIDKNYSTHYNKYIQCK